MKNHHAENAKNFDHCHLSRGADRIDSSGYSSQMKLGVIAVFCLLSIIGNIYREYRNIIFSVCPSCTDIFRYRFYGRHYLLCRACSRLNCCSFTQSDYDVHSLCDLWN